MRVLFRPEARIEALQAKDWYETHVPGLGYEFARALDVAVQSALRMPLAFPSIDAECRRVLLRRFPFSVIYCVGSSSLLVVAVFHHRREPGTWVGRIGG